MQQLLLVLFVIFTGAAYASCPPHAFTDPARVELKSDSVLIVTHASSNDDGRVASKFGVDEAIHFARKNRIPIVYLQDDRDAGNYFMADCIPDYWVHSQDGEINFDVPPNVYLAGGHLELCLSVTAHDVLMKWAKKPRVNHLMAFFMDGIFSNAKNIEESDPYYREYIRFMGIVNYGRPAGEHFAKLTLLETMGLIVSAERQYDYLKRTLPHYERSLPADYRVEISMSESRPRVLQAGKKQPDQSGRQPVLRFDFIDSADNLNYVDTDSCGGRRAAINCNGD